MSKQLTTSEAQTVLARHSKRCEVKARMRAGAIRDARHLGIPVRPAPGISLSGLAVLSTSQLRELTARVAELERRAQLGRNGKASAFNGNHSEHTEF